MKKKHNKTGLKYGQLTVLLRKEKIGKNWHWECLCECGVIRFINTCKLNNSKGGQKSCGCLKYRKSEDLVGQKFEKLTVVKFSHIHKKLRYLFWHCQCDCGNTIVLSTTALKRTDHPTRSCGCLRKEAVILSGHNFNRKKTTEASSNSLLYHYRKTAKTRNLSFNIDKEDFLSLTSKNCHYCGIEPKQIHTKRETNGDYIYNGLDRKDGNVGYELENVVTCCKTCNYAKRIMGYEEFLNWVRTVYEYIAKIN